MVVVRPGAHGLIAHLPLAPPPVNCVMWCMQECKRSAVTYISPEHILLALLGQPDASGRRVLER